MRSEDESIFWLARCAEDVSEFQPRWSANYYSISKPSLGDGDDEYSLCPSTDIIWRDVVLADITDFVRVTGKKLWLPFNIKSQLSTHDTVAGPVAVTSTPSPEADDEMVDVGLFAELMSRSSTARRMVSTPTESDFKVISRCFHSEF